jgi:hypothetical protein
LTSTTHGDCTKSIGSLSGSYGLGLGTVWTSPKLSIAWPDSNANALDESAPTLTIALMVQ